MLNVILALQQPTVFQKVKNYLEKIFPEVTICGFAQSVHDAVQLINEKMPQLAFIEVDMPTSNGFQILDDTSFSDFETIFFSNIPDHAVAAIQYQPSGFILKPIQQSQLVAAIESAKRRIKEKKVLQKLIRRSASEELIGIPTIEGFEYFKITEIIRCEGLQKCTRILTTNRTDIVSSYNIGEFKKRLEKYGFFAPHKSHLINLKQVQKYHKEGTITMRDSSCVPVARRRKTAFLEQLEHF